MFSPKLETNIVLEVTQTLQQLNQEIKGCVSQSQCVTMTGSVRVCAFFCIKQSSQLLWSLWSTKLKPGRAASLLRWINKILLSSTCTLARGFPLSVMHRVASSSILQRDSLLLTWSDNLLSLPTCLFNLHGVKENLILKVKQTNRKKVIIVTWILFALQVQHTLTAINFFHVVHILQKTDALLCIIEVNILKFKLKEVCLWCSILTRVTS